ncbi:MAG: hypothetical protein ACRC5A_16535 [Enterobacteriaceae bacterium]
MLRAFFAPALLLVAIATAPVVQALQFSNASPIIAPQQSHAAIKVVNTIDRATFVTLDIQQISLPTAQGVPIKHGADIVASQKRFILPANQQVPIILQYRGPQDSQERYYRVTWRQQFVQYNTAANRMLPLTIDTLLVVNPRKDNFHYLYNNGSLINSGNSSFRVSAYGKCAQSQATCSEEAYLLPGETSRLAKIDMQSSSSWLSISYNDRFYSVR